MELNFSAPVKIVLGGMAGKKAAWSRGSATLHAISLQCTSATDASNIVGNGECYANSGTDLVIWTYHFTSFAAYTPAAAASAPSAGPSGGGYCYTNWTCSDFSVCTNGQQTRTCSKVKNLCSAGDEPALTQACGAGTTPTETTTPTTAGKVKGAITSIKPETWAWAVVVVLVVGLIVSYVMMRKPGKKGHETVKMINKMVDHHHHK